jgi:hypothetical protein
MKRVRFTEDQIIAVLREHEAGAKTGDLARKTWSRKPRSTSGRYSNSDVRFQQSWKNAKICATWGPLGGMS